MSISTSAFFNASLIKHERKILTNAQILTLPSTHIELLPVVTNTKFRRSFVGYSLTINTLAGNYTNVANATTGILFLQLATHRNASGDFNKIFATISFDELYSVLFAQPALWCWDVGERVSIGTVGHMDDNVGTDGYIMANARISVLNLSDAIDKGCGALTTWIDNYDGDYDTDKGNFVGGNVANSMIFDIYYRDVLFN